MNWTQFISALAGMLIIVMMFCAAALIINWAIN